MDTQIYRLNKRQEGLVKDFIKTKVHAVEIHPGLYMADSEVVGSNGRPCGVETAIFSFKDEDLYLITSYSGMGGMRVLAIRGCIDELVNS